VGVYIAVGWVGAGREGHTAGGKGRWAGKDCRRAEGEEVVEEEEEGVVGDSFDAVVAVGGVAVVAGVAIEHRSRSWRRGHCALAEDGEAAEEETRSIRLAGPGHGPAGSRRHNLGELVGGEEGQAAAGVAGA